MKLMFSSVSSFFQKKLHFILVVFRRSRKTYMEKNLIPNHCEDSAKMTMNGHEQNFDHKNVENIIFGIIHIVRPNPTKC